MCGIAGVIGSPLPPRRHVERMRDALAHRGPDHAGLWIGPGAAIGHRRLAVVDPTPGGHQPMVSPDGRYVLAYNGELYNDSELRNTLGSDQWRSTCDTETLLSWLSGRGNVSELLSHIRGMFAVAFVDTRARTLTLARDPLGIKPMFWARLAGRVIFASEMHALFAHPELSPEPDPLGVSLYLSSVRTVMGAQTLFRGVRSVEPGQVLTFDLENPDADPIESRVAITAATDEPSDDDLALAIDEAVRVHLRSDVSLCAMLSGGLDSSIIVDAASSRVDHLRTYCAGANANEGDPVHAAQVATALGTTHRTALLDETLFTSLWIDTIARTGLPLATPNEVAIRLIARTLRTEGQIVTLSGEGADELFAGYDAPLTAAIGASVGGGRHELDANAWVPADIKPVLLVGELAHAASSGESLIELYESAFAHTNRGESLGPAASHLRFQRSVNLPMLLHRLDTATMLESVEGRTPFADARVAAMAAALPMHRLFDPAGETPATRTKLALRQAFRDRVPRSVYERAKASFPVPFEQWMSGVAAIARSSAAGRSLVQPALLAALADQPAAHWHLAWPVFNLVLWAERWWGTGLANATGLDAASHVAEIV